MSMHAQRKGRISSKKIRRLILVSLIVAVFALGATAAVSLRGGLAKTVKPQPSSAQTNNTGAGNTGAGNTRSTLRFAGGPIPLDPQTGQVRPLTPEEAQKLAASLKQLVNQSTEGLQSVKHADGSASVDLQGRFQTIAVAKRDEDGELVQSCVDNPESAAAFFGIDPQLVGVKKNAAAPRVTPGANSAARQKGVDR